MALPRWLKRGFRGKRWRLAIGAVLRAWNRHGATRLVIALASVWTLGALSLWLVEGETEGYSRLGEAFWNVGLIMFSGVNAAPTSSIGRSLALLLALSGVALAGLFTATVASVLLESLLRRGPMPSTDMEGHLVICNWTPRCLEWIREVHSNIVQEKRPVVIIHDTPDDIDLPDRNDDPAFAGIYIVKGDPVNEVVLRRAKVAQAYSVVVFSDERLGEHADGKTILACIAVRSVCRGDDRPNLVAECLEPRFRQHIRKAGADEVISSGELGLRLLARASLYHGMTRVYQELLTVGRDANEMFLVPIPAEMVGRRFVDVAMEYLANREDKRACMLIGIQRGDLMMLNPIGGEAGPLREGDELILLSQVVPNLGKPATNDK